MKNLVALALSSVLVGCTSNQADLGELERRPLGSSCPTPIIDFIDNELIIQLPKTIISAYFNGENFYKLTILENREEPEHFFPGRDSNFNLPAEYSRYNDQEHLKELKKY